MYANLYHYYYFLQKTKSKKQCCILLGRSALVQAFFELQLFFVFNTCVEVDIWSSLLSPPLYNKQSKRNHFSTLQGYTIKSFSNIPALYLNMYDIVDIYLLLLLFSFNKQKKEGI